MVVVKKFYNLFYIFIISSVLGYIIEFLWTFFVHGMLINHSAVVIGPFNFAYGICAIMLTILLYNYKNDSYFKIFVLSFIGGSILEYIMSFGMELVLGFTAWDYSNYFLNINGRICFLYSLFWGLLGVLWIKLIYPRLEKILYKIDIDISKYVVSGLIIFLVADILLTISAINRAKDYDKGVEANNKYEEFLDNTFNKEYLRNMYNNNWK